MTTQAQPHVSQEMTGPRSRWRTIAGIGLLLILFGVVFLYRLDQVPAPWHDEATYLQVAENYAENGVYASFSSEGDRYTGPIISIGPTVILPIALVYRLFGVSIIGARLVMAAYALLALLMLYGLTAALGDRRLALLAVLLAVFSYGLNLPYYARNVTGEVPALCFTFGALWLWLQRGKRRLSTLVAVGVLFGLGCITKNQFALVICPGLLAAWLLELGWYRRRGSLHFVIPGAITGLVFAAWTVYVLYLHDAGVRDVAVDLASLGEAAANGFLILDPSVFGSNLWYLMGGWHFSGIFLVVLLFGFILGLRRDEAGQRWGTLTAFALIGLAMFTTSIGWERFAVPALALAVPLFARLVFELTRDWHTDWRALVSRLRHASPSTADMAALAGIVLLAGTVIPAAFREAYHVIKRANDAPYRVADYIEEEIPPDALIETWEMELSVLTDHTFHHPPQIVEAYAIEQWHFAGPPASSRYAFQDVVNPDYVIVGDFGKWSTLYPPEHLTGYTLIQTIGEYDIYQRTN